MKSDYLGPGGIYALRDERVVIALSPRNGTGERLTEEDGEGLVLTNKRVIQFAGHGRARQMAAAALRDVHSVSMTVSRRKISTLIWGLLGVAGGIVLYRVLLSSFENTAVALALGLLSALLGLVLIVDYVSSQKEVAVSLHSGAQKIRGSVRGNGGEEHAYVFLNKVFELKAMAEGNVAPSGAPAPETPEEGVVSAPGAQEDAAADHGPSEEGRGKPPVEEEDVSPAPLAQHSEEDPDAQEDAAAVAASQILETEDHAHETPGPTAQGAASPGEDWETRPDSTESFGPGQDADSQRRRS